LSQATSTVAKSRTTTIDLIEECMVSIPTGACSVQKISDRRACSCNTEFVISCWRLALPQASCLRLCRSGQFAAYSFMYRYCTNLIVEQRMRLICLHRYKLIWLLKFQWPVRTDCIKHNDISFSLLQVKETEVIHARIFNTFRRLLAWNLFATDMSQ
jgi:hypothetical protein